MTETSANPTFFMPRDLRCPFDPPPERTRSREAGEPRRTALWDGSQPWMVTGYDDVRAVLSNPRMSSDSDVPGFPHPSAAARVRRRTDKPFLRMDDPQHAAQRKMISRDFMVKRMLALRPRVQEIVDGQIDEMLAGPNPTDFVQAFALPVPLLVICELLGVPFEDHQRFHALGNVVTHHESTPEQAGAATLELLEYLGDLVRRKQRSPGDDLLSRLVVDHVEADHLTLDQAANMGLMLLLAGHETTANMIALSTLLLLEHPETLRRIRDTDDDALIANAVEELLRYLTVPQIGMRRVALDDIEVGGRLIRAGEGVISALDTANRDPDAFEDPDRFDIDRKARHHVAFGFGVHQCLGQPLARVELQVVLSTLYRRIPTLRPATGRDELTFKELTTAYGINTFPVAW